MNTEPTIQAQEGYKLTLTLPALSTIQALTIGPNKKTIEGRIALKENLSNQSYGCYPSQLAYGCQMPRIVLVDNSGAIDLCFLNHDLGFFNSFNEGDAVVVTGGQVCNAIDRQVNSSKLALDCSKANFKIYALSPDKSSHLPKNFSMLDSLACLEDVTEGAIVSVKALIRVSSVQEQSNHHGNVNRGGFTLKVVVVDQSLKQVDLYITCPLSQRSAQLLKEYNRILIERAVVGPSSLFSKTLIINRGSRISLINSAEPSDPLVQLQSKLLFTDVEATKRRELNQVAQAPTQVVQQPVHQQLFVNGPGQPAPQTPTQASVAPPLHVPNPISASVTVEQTPISTPAESRPTTASQPQTQQHPQSGGFFSNARRQSQPTAPTPTIMNPMNVFFRPLDQVSHAASTPHQYIDFESNEDGSFEDVNGNEYA